MPTSSARKKDKPVNPDKSRKPLEPQDCGDAWEAVCTCLRNVNGLTVTEKTIYAAQKLGKNADLNSMAEAIGILANEKAFKAAYMLILMCKAAVLLDLLDKCSPHLTQSKTSKKEGVARARNETFSIAAREAWRRQNLSQFFKLLPPCSRETRADLAVMYGSLTKAMVEDDLDEDALIEAVRTELERLPAPGTAGYLTDLHSLLSIAGELEDGAPAKAATMKCIIWSALPMNQTSHGVDPLAALRTMAWFPALTPQLLGHVPAQLRSEVLRVAVSQTVAQRSSESVMKRLSELASLSKEIDPELAKALRSHLMDALMGLPEQWEQAAFESHAQSLQDILQELTGKLDDLQDVDKFAELTRQLLDNSSTTKQKSDALLLMVTLVAKLPDIVQAVSHLQRLHLWLSLRIDAALVAELQLRIKWALSDLPVHIRESMMEVLQTGRRARDVQQALSAGKIKEAKLQIVNSDITFHEVATARLIEFEFNDNESADVGMQEQNIKHEEEAAKRQVSQVRAVLGKLGFGGDDPLKQMRAALPTLCDGSKGTELELILATDQGRNLTAQAVIDYLWMTNPDGHQVVSLFTALAHRVDLRAALQEQRTWVLLEEKMKSVKVDEGKLTQSLDQWSPGWRTLLIMNTHPALLLEDAFRRRLAIMAVDAAAAGAGTGGNVFNLADPTLDDWVQEALGSMLKVLVAAKPLLSDQALANVMRAVVSNEALTERTFKWINDRSEDEKAKLYTVTALELIKAARVDLPSVLHGQLPANTAAAYAASLLLTAPSTAEIVVRNLEKKAKDQLWELAAQKI